MNKWIGMGRLTKDPEIRYTKGSNPFPIADYTLAVDRRLAADEAQQTDYIPCTAYGKLAEFAEKYLHKGNKIAVVGRIRTDSWDGEDGKKKYKTSVIVDEHYFAEKAKQD